MEYYKSFEVLTLEEAEALADDVWIEGKSLEAKVRDEEQFYLYVRFTDGAGNKSIINTDGIVMHLSDETDDAVTTGSPVTGQDRVASRVVVWTIMGATILLALTIRRKMTM